MAIQQIVPITINLQGDGTSTVFKYTPTSFFAVTATDPNLKFISLTTTPTSVTAFGSFGIVITSAMVSGKIVLTFASAPANGQQGTVTINFAFNSQ